MPVQLKCYPCQDFWETERINPNVTEWVTTDPDKCCFRLRPPLPGEAKQPVFGMKVSKSMNINF